MAQIAEACQAGIAALRQARKLTQVGLNVLLPVFGDLPPEQITPEDRRDYIGKPGRPDVGMRRSGPGCLACALR